MSRFSWVFVFALVLQSCSTPTWKPKAYTMHAIAVEAIRFRRPAERAALAHALPQGSDHSAKTEERYSCKRVEDFFAGLDLPQARACLNGLSDQEGEYSYVLDLNPRPFLRLEDVEEAPSCLADTLSKIPVPRELFFLEESEQEEKKECYSSRLDVEKNEVLGLRLAFFDPRVLLHFPKDSFPLESDAALLRYLGAVVLTPFLGEKKQSFKTYFVPPRVCEVCYGREDYLRLQKVPLRAYWPQMEK